MRNGYIKLHRKILDWEWYGDVNTRLVFIHLLICAEWDCREYRGVRLERGQLATTVKELAANNGLTIQQTKTALSHLRSTNEITISANTKFSIITVNNFDYYQAANNQSNQPATTQQQTGRQTNIEQISQPTLLYKENKNVRSEEEVADATSAPPTASLNRASLIESFGEENVDEYERRYDNWKAKKGGVVMGDRYATIRRMMEQDGVRKPSVGNTSFDVDEVRESIWRRYRS